MNKCVTLLSILALSLAGTVAMVVTPAQAANYSFCQGTGGTHFTLPNLTFEAGSLPPAGQILYTSPPYTISYQCSTEYASYYKYAPTLQKLGDFQAAVTALTNAGLGLNILIQEQGQPLVTWGWNDMQYGSGHQSFGAPIPPNSDNVARTATFRLQLMVIRKIDNAQIVQVPSLSAFSIIPSPSHTAAPAVQITSSPFAIRYMPSNFGYVSLSPSLVSFGHIYTDYPMSGKKVSFSLTAGQRAGVGGPNSSFTIPLKATFTVNGKALTDTGQSAILTTDDGQPNGLKLSLSDTDSGNRLTFAQPLAIGTLTSASPGVLATPIRKTYTALLETIPGQPLRTGPFSADVVVTVTYD
ncbi:hypothetical protein ACXKEL_002873 [Salmonella enterica]